ncbi:MAG: hypothetical protein IPL81_12690 [Flavobacteriales bacterium]|nr:hypothetical protein [Flavobacteriales bacterium]
MIWKKGRGTLGPLAPLFGSWEAGADSPMGKVRCTRVFTAVLGGKYIALDCAWHFGKGAYEERALFGADNGVLSFWSFTSDGKRSSGVLSTAPDIHTDAICFEAKMLGRYCAAGLLAPRRRRLQLGGGEQDEEGLEPVYAAPLPGQAVTLS